jgi:hypothetical protein
MFGVLFRKICSLIRKIGVGGLRGRSRLWSEFNRREVRQV